MTLKTLLWTIFLLTAPIFSPAYGFAQSPYSAAVIVNGSGVTYFEINQRARMLGALGSIGDLKNIARKDLINERLKAFAGKLLGLSVTDNELKAGMAEFAKRVNLTTAQFVAELAKAGVYPETFRNFTRSGLLWRKVVQTKFQAKAFITDSELDTAMALGTTAVGASALLSEIVVPYTPATKSDTLALLKELSTSIRTAADFEQDALTYSAAPSRANSGKLDWTPISSLSPTIGAIILTLKVGQVSAPVQLPNAYALFQLRGLRDNRTIAARTIAYDYATLQLPGGRSAATLKQAAKIIGAVDTCNDLVAQAAKFPPQNFKQQVLPVAKVPKRIAAVLTNLDRDEISTTLTSGKNGKFLTVLMLCGRTNKITEGNRDAVRAAMFNQRIAAFGDGYLQELKSDAIIENK